MAKAKEASLPPPSSEPWLTLRQAAAHLGFTPRALYLRLYKGQEIPCDKIGRMYRFRKSALDAWVNGSPAPLHQDEVVSRPKAGRRKRATP